MQISRSYWQKSLVALVTAYAFFVNALVAPSQAFAGTPNPTPLFTADDFLDTADLEQLKPEQSKSDPSNTQSIYLVSSGTEQTPRNLTRIRSGEIESIELRYNLTEGLENSRGAFFQVIHHPGLDTDGSIVAPRYLGRPIRETTKGSKYVRGMSAADYQLAALYLEQDFNKMWGDFLKARSAIGLLGSAGSVGTLYGVTKAISKIENQKLSSFAAAAEAFLGAVPRAPKVQIRAGERAGQMVISKNPFRWLQENWILIMFVGSVVAAATIGYSQTSAAADHVIFGEDAKRRDLLHRYLESAYKRITLGQAIAPQQFDEAENAKRLKMLIESDGLEDAAEKLAKSDAARPAMPLGPARDIVPTFERDDMGEIVEAFQMFFDSYQKSAKEDRDTIRNGLPDPATHGGRP